MNARTTLITIAVVAALGAAGYGAYRLGMNRGMSMVAPGAGAPDPGVAAQPPPSTAQGEEATRRHIAEGLKAGDVDPATGRRILYYRDPMAPGTRFDKPAKSPFMDMMLVPVYADGGDGDAGKVAVSARMQQNLGMRTATVTEGMLAPQLTAVGSIAFNERDQAYVAARATGYVERLHVRATLDRVARGQPLVDLYVPDWVAAQEEFLALRRTAGNDAALVDAARQRMRQAGMSDVQIAAVESDGRTQARMTLTAPIAGVVTELAARDGMTVSSGTTLVRISGLGTVWANAEVPESLAALLRPGAKVRATSPAVPGATFEGTVQALLPEVNAATRTLKARMELANPGARLVPGMFVQMQFLDTRARKSLLVPTEAVIQTGRRTVVMLAEADGRFRPVDVEIGIETGAQTEVKRGLLAGQRVVVSSQFLIDSEASLRGVEARLGEGAAPAAPPSAAAQKHRGIGRIESIEKDGLMLTHDPIESLKWPGMTMEFKAPAAGVPPGLAPGDAIAFEFVMESDGPRLTVVERAVGQAGEKKVGKTVEKHGGHK
jgi:Cu(I)/Ag(I) efflux system membrane fusion protein